MTEHMPQPDRTKVIVGICTYRRPEMLQACLRSILEQQKPEAWEVEIVVVDNDPQSDQGETLTFPDAQFEVHYFIETQRGIPYARNAVCRHAVALGADYLLFIDDDEEAAPGWLVAYQHGHAQFDGEAYTGPVRYLFPEGYQDWLGNKGHGRTKHGALLRRAATNNVMFATRILTIRGGTLEFDNRMALTGGEDKDFFTRLVHQGGRIVYLSDALVSEEVLPNRLSMCWRLRRQYQSSASGVYIDAKLFGPDKILWPALREMLRHLVEGLIGLVLSPFLLLVGVPRFKRGWYHGLRHFAKAAGIIAGLRGWEVQLYANTDGH
jgi:succinoglycan biosynthesis protein ExoM